MASSQIWLNRREKNSWRQLHCCSLLIQNAALSWKAKSTGLDGCTHPSTYRKNKLFSSFLKQHMTRLPLSHPVACLWSSAYCCHKTCSSRLFSASQLLHIALKPHIPPSVSLFQGWSSGQVGCFPVTGTFPSEPLPTKHVHTHTF